MLSSVTFTVLLAAALASASPTRDTNTISVPRQDDPTLVIFKTYADASTCRGGQGSDSYTSIVFGSRSQAVSGECMSFDAVGTIGGGSLGWDGLKAIARYPTDFNVTAYAYTTTDCVDTNGDKAALYDSVCHDSATNYLSWNFVKW